MNPLASSKCVSRLLMALAAITSIFLTIGCGSGGSSIPPLGGGFSKASMNGQYVIALTGIGVNQQLTASDPFSEIIVFTADGSGKLTVTDDDFDQIGGPFGGPENLAGTYGVASDGTGFLSFGGFNYAITVIDDSHFYVIEQDFFATASGFGEKQDTTKFTAGPSGPFIFKAHNLGISSQVGGITITGGAIAGTEDFLSRGFLSTSQAIATSVAMNAPDSLNGRGQFTLSDGRSYNYFVVNLGKFLFMSKSSGSLEIGQAEAQTGSFSLATLASGNSYVFGSSGDTSLPLGIHSAGVFTTDGNGGVKAGDSTTPGAVDYVQDGVADPNLPFTVSVGTYTLDSTGHGEIDLTLGVGTIRQKFWMVNGNRAYFLADNAAAVEDGTFSQQQGAPFNALSSQAAFVMDGFDVAYKDRVGAFEPTSSTFKWTQAANSFDTTLGIGTLTTLPTNGTYQVSSNGRVTVNVNGVTSPLVFYLSSPNTGFMVQEDGADIGGAFTQQASQ